MSAPRSPSRALAVFAPAGLPALNEPTWPSAFDRLKTMPPGCVPIYVRNDQAEPHFYEGHYAVVDATQKDVIWGEAFAVMYRNGPAFWRVCRPSEKMANALRCGGSLEPCAVLQPLLLNTDAAFEAWRSGSRQVRIRLSDGPIPLNYLREITIGRIIGLWAPG